MKARSRSVALILFLLPIASILAASPSDPLVDTGLTVVTPRPDPDLVLVRERFFGSPGVDLTPFGIGTGADDYVQSIYFRFYAQNPGGAEDSLTGAVTFPPGIRILGFITGPSQLGSSTAGGPYTGSDALFAVASNPDDYAAAPRGFEPPGTGTGSAEYICQTDERSFVFAMNVTGGMDDFRVVIDYGSSFSPGLSFQVDLVEDMIGGAIGSVGIQLGNPSASGVPGEGDYGEAHHLVRIPLTTTLPPVAGTTPPVAGGGVIYLARETGADPMVDGLDVGGPASLPGLIEVPAAAVFAPRGVAFGDDGLLYLSGDETGLASVDTATGTVTSIGVPDLPGAIARMTSLPGDSRLFFARQTSFPEPEDAWVDIYDTVTGAFTPAFATFPRNALRSPVDILPGGDGQLYLVSPGPFLHRVDPATGSVTLDAVTFSDLTGNYVKGTVRPGTTLLYLLRDTNGATFVDEVDVATGAFNGGFLTIPSIPNPAAVIVDNDGMVWVFGKEGGVVGLDPAAPADPPFYETACLDFDGFITYAAIPRTPPEVSAPGAARQVDVTIAPSGPDLRLHWQDLAIPGLSYNIYAGLLGSYYSHASAVCHLAGTSDGAGALFTDIAEPAGSAYFLVTASSNAGEGTAGHGRPIAAVPPACGPSP